MEPGFHQVWTAVEVGRPGVVVVVRSTHSVYSRAPQVLRARIALCSRPNLHIVIYRLIYTF